MSGATPRLSVYWRVKWAAVGAVAALLLVGLAWILTTVVKSPQDALASAAPPPPSRITVPVEESRLDLDVDVEGVVRGSRSVTGALGVDDRAHLAESNVFIVPSGRQAIPATMKSIEADGAFQAVPSKPLDSGKDAHVKVEIRPRTAPADSLIVPMSALFTAADGHVAVVTYAKGVEHQVTVRMGRNAKGFVEVTPARAGALKKGDHVLVSEPAS